MPFCCEISVVTVTVEFQAVVLHMPGEELPDDRHCCARSAGLSRWLGAQIRMHQDVTEKA